METKEIRQKITNHPLINELERDVVVYRIADNMDVQEIQISAKIEHFKKVDDERVLLPEFTRHVEDWVISNQYLIKKRDSKNKPVLDEDEKEVKIPAFEAYQAMLLNVLSPLIKVGIINDDEEIKRFDI